MKKYVLTESGIIINSSQIINIDGGMVTWIGKVALGNEYSPVQITDKVISSADKKEELL